MDETGKTMTKTEHAKFLRAGCDPTCHTCSRKIPVGAEYGMKKPVNSSIFARLEHVD